MGGHRTPSTSPGSRSFGRLPQLLLASMFVISSVLILPGPLAGPAAATPWTGSEPTPTDLTLYLHNSSLAQPIVGGLEENLLLNTTNDTAPGVATEGGISSSVHYLAVTFYLFPHLAGPLFLNGTPQAVVYASLTGTAKNLGWALDLSSISPNGTTQLLGTFGMTSSLTLVSGAPPVPFLIDQGTPLNTTVPAGDSLEATFYQYCGSCNANSADTYRFYWGDVGGTYYPALLNLSASTYLDVPQTYLATVNGTPVSDLNGSGATLVNVTANVTDPLGNYDFSAFPVDWSVQNLSLGVALSGTLSPVAPAVPPVPGGAYELYRAPFNYSSLRTGTYELCANASDVTYHNAPGNSTGYVGRIASGCSTFSIVSGIKYPVTLTLLDSLGHPLSGASASVFGETRSSNSSGAVLFDLPNGTFFGLSVLWDGVDVAPTPFNFTVSGPTSENVTTEVFYPTFLIADHSGHPLANALVYIVPPNGTHLPLIVTNATGEIPLLQVPGGEYGITVLWHDSVVYSQPADPLVLVSGNGILTLSTDVYDQVFQVVTASGAPLSLARLEIENATSGVIVFFGTTNASGENTSIVPQGAFDVVVYWQSSEVARLQGLVLPATAYPAPYRIAAGVYNVSFLATDSKGLAVGSAEIEISGSSGLLTTLLTDASGNASMPLAAGTYQVVTLWDGVQVSSTTLDVNRTTTVPLSLSIYYLTVTCLSSSGSNLAGVDLEVVSATLQTILTSATTAGEPLTFRLPGGTYEITGSYHGTYGYSAVSQTLTKNVQLSGTATVTLKFTQVNPPFTSTLEFGAIVFLAVLFVIMIVLLALLLRRGRSSGGAKKSTAPETPPKSEPAPSSETAAASAPSGTDQAPQGSASEEVKA